MLTSLCFLGLVAFSYTQTLLSGYQPSCPEDLHGPAHICQDLPMHSDHGQHKVAEKSLAGQGKWLFQLHILLQNGTSLNTKPAEEKALLENSHSGVCQQLLERSSAEFLKLFKVFGSFCRGLLSFLMKK